MAPFGVKKMRANLPKRDELLLRTCEALRGTQWRSAALSRTQWHSVALSGTQWHSVALSCHCGPER